MTETVFHKGALLELELENFMSYKDRISFRPDNGFNVILGPNGTGKSSIQIAMIIGLGGKLSTLKRQKSLAELVNRDAMPGGSAEINIKLAKKDVQSLAAAKKEDYVTIRCNIEKSGQSYFFIDEDRRGRDEVFDLVRNKFKIQTDNLCHFLAQDTVREFSQLNPQSVFSASMAAIGNTDISHEFENLKDLHIKITATKKTIGVKDSTLVNLESDLRQKEEKELAAKKKEEICGKLELLRKQQIFLEVKSMRKVIATKRKLNEKMTVEVDAVKTKCDKLKVELNKFHAKIDDKQKALKANRTTIAEVEQYMENSNVKQVKEKIAAKEEIIVEFEEKLRSREENIKKVEDELKELRHKRGSIDVERLTHENLQAQNMLDKLQSEAEAIQDQIRRRKARSSVYQASIASNQSNIKKFTDFDERALRVLRTKNPEAYKAVMWLRENKHSSGFRKPEAVYEPIMMYLNIPEKYAIQVENTVNGRDLEAFVTDDPEDAKLLMKVLRQDLKLSRINVVSAAGGRSSSFPQPDWDKKLSPNVKRVFLSELITKIPPVIIRFLCSTKSFHKIAIFEKDPPETFDTSLAWKFFVGKERHTVVKSKYTQKAITETVDLRSHRLAYLLSAQAEAAADEGDRLKQLHSLLESDQEALKKIEAELTEMTHRSAEKKSEISTLKSKLSNLRRLEGEAKSLDMTIQIKEDTLNEYKAKDVGKTLANLKAELKKLMEVDLPNANKFLGMMMKKLSTATEKLVKINIEIEMLQEQNSAVTDAMETAMAEFEDKSGTWSRIKEELTKIYAELKKKISSANWLTQQQRKDLDCDLPEEVWTAIDEAGCRFSRVEEIKSEWVLLDKEKKALPTMSEQEINDLKSQREKQLSLKEELAHLRRSAADLEGQFVTNERALSNKINSVTERINNRFGRLMADVGYSGEVILHKGDNHLDLKEYGLMIMVKFREQDRLQPLKASVQSGGEKSVTTALYIMALQSFKDVPLRFVDEINQGMDLNNEISLWKKMIESAQADSAQFFYTAQKYPSQIEFSSQMKITICFSGSRLSTEDHSRIEARRTLEKLKSKRKPINRNQPQRPRSSRAANAKR